MINIIYIKDSLDSLVAKEILVKYLNTNNNSNYKTLSYDEIQENIDSFDLLNDKFYIIGYNEYSNVGKAIINNLIKNKNLVIFEFNEYNIKKFKYNFILPKNRTVLVYDKFKNLSLLVYEYFYNRDNLNDINNSLGIVNDISNYLTCNYNIENEEDLAKKYLLLNNKLFIDNKVDNKYLANIVKHVFNSSKPELYTQEEYDNIFTDKLNGHFIKNTYFINSDNNILYKDLEDYEYNYFCIYYKINANKNYVKLYFKPKELDLTNEVTDIEENVLYSLHNEDTDEWFNIRKNNDKYYIVRYNQYYKNEKIQLVDLTDVNYKIYDKSYYNIIEFNKFSCHDKLINKFGNANGNNYVSCSIATDKQLFNILQNGI